MISVTNKNANQAIGMFCNSLVDFQEKKDPKIFLMNHGNLIGNQKKTSNNDNKFSFFFSHFLSDSIKGFVCPSVRPSIHPSVTQKSSISHH